MNSKIKAALAVVALAAAGAANAAPIAPEGLFLSVRDSANLTSFVANLNLSTVQFRANSTTSYTLTGDGLADLTAYLSTANLASVTWDVAGASLGTVGTPLFGGLTTAVTNPASGFQDWGTDAIQATVNGFANFRGLTNAGLTSSDGWQTTGNNAFFAVYQWGTNILNASGVLGQALGFYSFFADQADPDFSGASTSFGGKWTLAFVNGVASLNFVSDSTPTVPVPAAVWLLASGVAGLFGVSRRKRVA